MFGMKDYIEPNAFKRYSQLIFIDGIVIWFLVAFDVMAIITAFAK